MKNWKSQMKTAGLDPANVVDAQTAVQVTVAKQDWKGSVNGDEFNCSGARCIKRHGAIWAMIGARIAIVAWSADDIQRYTHTGIVPNTQDSGRSPIGLVLGLRPPDKNRVLGANHKVSPKTGRKYAKDGSKPNRGKRIMSIAAELRA